MAEDNIYKSYRYSIHRIADAGGVGHLAVKVLNDDFPAPRDIDLLQNEHDVLLGMEVEGVRKVIRRGKYNNRHALFLEYRVGTTLLEAFEGRPAPIVDFLPIAIGFTESISEIHRHQIIHRDISPANVIVDPEAKTATVIDFGLATRFKLKEYHLGNPECLEGTLQYSSPEQTGRMNRAVDYRSDLYSLGVTFYQVLTGQLPFLQTDSMELVHAHLAIAPTPCHLLESHIPPVLGRIVDKLMAKNAEDRYQSASGLVYDLRHCQDYLERGQPIAEFRLGEHDFPSAFILPQQLYGRTGEIERLLEAFRVAASGVLQVMWVAGYSGTGKSALVREVHRPITRSRGYYIEGKFDQYQRAVPYSALLRAFIQLVELMLTEGDKTLRGLRNSLLEALGQEGRVITDVIPQLVHVIGVQPEVPALPGTEARNRFNYLMQKFVRAVAHPNRPLVLFIDDLQWADSASLHLIKLLATDPESGYLLLIGAYRDNEVDAVHPFMLAAREIEASGTACQTIPVTNLSDDDVTALLADALRVETEDDALISLSRLVMKKTAGNAFFVNQFLQSLYEEQLLHHNPSSRSWTWDIAAIKSRNITDNVVNLLTKRISKQSESTQHLLQCAACIGNSFTQYSLSVVGGCTVEQVPSVLSQALEEGMVVFAGDGNLRFSHDRIQQAVYSMIPAEDRNTTHYFIGRMLLEHLAPDEFDRYLFDVVNQLNYGIKRMSAPDERQRLAELNLQAGDRARHNAAFQTSFDYLATGISLLDATKWENQYTLTLSLHREAVEVAYLCGDFAAMNRLYAEILTNGKNILDKVKAYEVQILALKAENRLMDSITVGLEVLGQLGEKFPRRPHYGHTMWSFTNIAIRLRGRSIEELAALPEMTKLDKIAAQRIITDISNSAYWAYPALLPLLVFRSVSLSLDHGITAVSAFAFGSYGVMLCGVAEAMKLGYKYGMLAQLIVDKLDAKEWKVHICTLRYSLINFWCEHVRETLPYLQKSFQVGMETGSIEYACINTNAYCINSYLAGKPLKRLEEEARSYSESFRRLKQETNFNYNEVYRQAMLNFLGEANDPLTLTGEAYNEGEMLEQNRVRNDQTGTFFIHFHKLILGYHFGDHDMARLHGKQARTLFDAILAKFEIPTVLFYEALNCLVIAETASGIDRVNCLVRARTNEWRLRKFARSAPGNSAHKAWLIRAERYRVARRMPAAREAYETAIALALTHEYLQEAGLAYERTGLFYAGLGKEDLANHYMKRAYSMYEEWGGEAKLTWLRSTYPRYLVGMDQHQLQERHPATPEKAGSQHQATDLDLETLVKASTTISGQMDLSNLLTVMMRIVVENAGADRGVLLLADPGGELLMEAEMDIKTGHTSSVLQHERMVDQLGVSRAVVQYVQRTNEFLLLPDAQQDKRFGKGEYFRASGVKSLLCLPIRNQGKFLGVLYLENRVISGAFTHSRSRLLSLLAGQIAVSIDNAILYREMGQKVTARTAELAMEKAKSDELLRNILPEETARELKMYGKTTPRRFDRVTVLFTDFAGFTSIADQLSPEVLVTDLDTCFRAFDEIVQRHGLEKIKTIGDSYMCVGGLPVPTADHAHQCIQAALAMRDWMVTFNGERGLPGHPRYNIRIGLHSGPVIAGVVGSRKFAYDVWGDTVNTASRMESSGQVGKINISGPTCQQLGVDYECVYRGKITAKNKGEIDMYFVERATVPQPATPTH